MQKQTTVNYLNFHDERKHKNWQVEIKETSLEAGRT